MPLIKVAKASDVKDGEMIKAEINGVEVLVANIGGQFFAIADTCTHRQCSLSDGFMEGNEVICPCHAGRFDVTTGKATALPAVVDEKTYKVTVKGGDVFVEA